MVDEEDGAAHVFQRAPALQMLHERLEEAGVQITYRNEPGADMAFKLLFLDEQGTEFYNCNVLTFQGIKEAYTRFGTLHGSLPTAPALEEMYEGADKLTLAQLSYFEMVDKDPRAYVPQEYFAGLSALSNSYEACKTHFKLDFK